MGQSVGADLTRKEDGRFLNGVGCYTDDINLPGQAYAYILRSPHAHAAIRRIDIKPARSSQGVLCILTASDVDAERLGGVPCLRPIQNHDGTNCYVPPYPLLANDCVKHVGDPIAVVVAESAAQARDASELIRIDYEPLPAVVDTATAVEPGLPLVWEAAPRNICFRWEAGDAERTDAVFRQAAHIVRVKLINNRLVANSIEPRANIGVYDRATGTYTLYTSTHGPHLTQILLADAIFHEPKEKFRVIARDVGGSFGPKMHFYSDQPLVLLAARKVGRPVRWTSDRSETFLTETQGRDHVTRAELALSAEGRFLAFRCWKCANMGAYLSTFAPVIPTEVCRGMETGVYDVPVVYHSVTGVFTNTVPVDALRAAGRPETTFVIERLVDMAARELKIDPAELRRRNLIPPEALPYSTALGVTIDSGDFARNLRDALELAEWTRFPQRRDEAQRRGKSRGIGIATYLEISALPALGPETCTLRLEDNGVTVFVGTCSSGQGHETVFAQLVADYLGVPFDSVTVRQGDTQDLPTGGGTAGSRSVVVGGAAVAQAAGDLIRKARVMAGKLLEAAPYDIEFSSGWFTVRGTDRGLALLEVARRSSGEDLSATVTHTPEAPTFANGAHVCEVELDPDTGTIELLRYTAVDDFGRVVNPLLLAGQVHGAVAQGIGQALMEHAVYDSESGQILTRSFMDYCMPKATTLPSFTWKFNEIPCRTNPLGVKGAGEAGAVPAPAAVTNAVVDALAPWGVDHIDMPLTPQRIWRAIQEASRTPRRVSGHHALSES